MCRLNHDEQGPLRIRGIRKFRRAKVKFNLNIFIAALGINKFLGFAFNKSARCRDLFERDRSVIARFKIEELPSDLLIEVNLLPSLRTGAVTRLAHRREEGELRARQQVWDLISHSVTARAGGIRMIVSYGNTVLPVDFFAGGLAAMMMYSCTFLNKKLGG